MAQGLRRTELSMRIDHEELARRVRDARRILSACELCPRRCGANRLSGETGFCRVGHDPMISSYGPHFGEEPPLVGSHGSGTIFFTGCNLGCTYCQNFDISHLMRGEIVSVKDLAGMMLSLQATGCHNINLVTPTHQVPQILEALLIARENGLVLPIVYNCGGYESLRVLALLDGIVDIYMPDAKYMDTGPAKKLSGVGDYPAVVKDALLEMHRQVGDFRMTPEGIAMGGLLLRHLVLPERLAGTAELVQFVARHISPDTYINIMSQYRPCYKAAGVPSLDRRVLSREVDEAREMARREGLHRGFDEPFT
jgi:putative pyruvate formate lyase activating enzyme